MSLMTWDYVNESIPPSTMTCRSSVKRRQGDECMIDTDQMFCLAVAQLHWKQALSHAKEHACRERKEREVSHRSCALEL